MKITKLSIENFKKFKDRFEFDFSNQIFLVGENNTGKTSVIDAINYLLNGPRKDKRYKNLSCDTSDYIVIEAEIYGDFSNVDKKYQEYVLIDSEGNSYMKIRRSDKEETISQSGKDVKLNESKILCWNNTTSQFENPAGKDTTFNVVEVVSIYANDHVDDVVSFDSSKILGKLIKNSVGNFFETDDYKAFVTHHDAVFNTGDNSLKSRLNTLSEDISNILREQWGELELSFKFDLADNVNHLKKGTVLVKEGETEPHELDDKGSGLQRAVMLSMIQVLSKIHTLDVDNNTILCIDEPELNLHPTAQIKLAEALCRLSDIFQVIVSVHSPYMLKSFRKSRDSVYVFLGGQFADPKKLETVTVLPFGPTLAEIQYFAYNLTPNDLHNELYGYLESESKLAFANSKRWLDKRCLLKYSADNNLDIASVDGVQRESLKKDVSLQEYIRHSIHHPDNRENLSPTEQEVKQSIDEMIQCI